MSELPAAQVVDGVLVLRGAIDIAAAPAVRAAVRELPPTDTLVVDLSACTFLDSSGMNELVRLATGDARVVLRAVPERIQRVLAVAGLEELLPPEG
jgi:anti-anti-sigma factor